MGEAERRANLQRGQWHSRGHADRPEVLTVGEAWHRSMENLVFYSVAWWGDWPAGFQELRFVEAQETAFRVLLATGSREQEASLEADELVLAFAILLDAEAGAGPSPNDFDA